MPDVERLRTLVDRLRELSGENRVPWTETADERAFQAALKGGVVSISQEEGGYSYGEPTYRYVIRFFDPAGKLLDSATAEDFPERYAFAGGKQPFEALSELHDMARRKALKVDQALDALLESL